jgi:hypothetical protein
MRRALAIGGVTLVALAIALFWLRDPAWLAGIESGFMGWQVDAEQTKYRWTAGHSSFFVPASASEVRIPLRTGRDTEGWAVVVIISIDDRMADRVSLTSNTWHISRVRLPAPGSRHLRRIDIHVDRTVDGSRGVQVGEIQIGR